MDNYFEQSVAGERGPRERMLYGACWVALVLLALVAIASAASILRFGDGGIRISWLSAALTLIAAALAVLLYRTKDGVYREYDYILWNGELEICAVYNRKRRKKLGTIPLNKVSAWGPAERLAGPMHGAKAQRWCVREERAWCLVYASEAGKQAALLELSDEMQAQLRGVSSALRMAEVKA